MKPQFLTLKSDLWFPKYMFSDCQDLTWTKATYNCLWLNTSLRRSTLILSKVWPYLLFIVMAIDSFVGNCRRFKVKGYTSSQYNAIQCMYTISPDLSAVSIRQRRRLFTSSNTFNRVPIHKPSLMLKFRFNYQNAKLISLLSRFSVLSTLISIP